MRPPHQVMIGALGLGVAALVLFTLREVPSPAPETASDVSPMTVLLVVVDTLRADRLSTYGYSAHSTPSIDALARGGVVFEEAHSAAPWTLPSMGALMTSHLPSALGLVETGPDPVEDQPDGNPLHRKRREQLRMGFPSAAPSLAELFAAMGWTTAAFINQPLLSTAPSFLRGFQLVHHPTERGVVVRAESEPSASTGQPWASAKYALENDLALIDSLDSWLAGVDDRRAFIWLHLLTPHLPYQPTGDGLAVPGKAVGEEPGPMGRLSAAYDGEVRAVDRAVGQAIEVVRRHRGADRTLIVLTSDHGEEFFEHGSFEHGHSLHREVIRVPLVLAGPGVPEGERIATRVRTIDILPTLLDLTGGVGRVPPAVAGSSLVPIMAGEERADRRSYSEAMLYGRTERSLSDGTHRLLLDVGGASLLFDTASDVDELHDLRAEAPDRARSLERDIGQMHAELLSERERIDQRSEPTPDTRAAVPMEDALRALGYAE